jgi:hypothetical protein
MCGAGPLSVVEPVKDSNMATSNDIDKELDTDTSDPCLSWVLVGVL